MLELWSRAFRPKPRFSTADWIQRNVILPPEISATPGHYSLSGREYLLGPLDAVDDPEVHEIVLQWPTQVGKTTFLQALLMSFADIFPSPAMLAGPDQDEVLKLRDDFYRMCAASTRLRHSIPPERLRNDRWLDYAGVRCYLAWAGNTQRLAGKSCRTVLATEIDKWSQSTREGNTQALARNRVKAWFRYLILWESTPTDEQSAVAQLYEMSNRCRFHVPCPHCWHFQPFRREVHVDGPYAGFGGLSGIRNRDGSFVSADEAMAKAHYLCEQGCRIENTDKAWMVARGVWVPQGQTAQVRGRPKKLERESIELVGTPERSPRISGYQMCSLVSATISFGKYAAAWIQARDDEKLMQDLVNNWDGEKWTKRVKVLRWDKIHTRLRATHPRGHLPADAIFVTCGCDTQGDRCYYVVRAWGEGATSWLVDWGCYHQAIGSDGLASYNSDLNRLDAQLVQHYPLLSPNPVGMRTLQIRLMGIDTQWQPHRVWNWVRVRNQERVRAIAGDSQMNEPYFRMTVVERSARDGKPYEGGMKRWGINTLTYKTDLQGRWNQPLNEPGAWLLCGSSREEMETYLRQLTNEGPQTTVNKRGRPQTVWTVLERNVGNHFWDCEVYARALADMVTGGEWTRLAERARPVESRIHSGQPQEGFGARD